jgi:hypothetical protein
MEFSLLTPANPAFSWQNHRFGWPNCGLKSWGSALWMEQVEGGVGVSGLERAIKVSADPDAPVLGWWQGGEHDR